MQRAKAIIFDPDRVLTDNFEYHFSGWKRLADDSSNSKSATNLFVYAAGSV